VVKLLVTEDSLTRRPKTLRWSRHQDKKKKKKKMGEKKV